MKAAVTILFSVLLLWGQSVAAWAPLHEQPAAKCASCSCQMVDCCPAPAAPVSPAPAAPARTASQESFQFVPIVVTESAPLPLVSVVDFLSPALPSMGLAAVPLYERDCSYLI